MFPQANGGSKPKPTKRPAMTDEERAAYYVRSYRVLLLVFSFCHELGICVCAGAHSEPQGFKKG